MSQELTAVVMPNGTIQLEWIDSDTKTDKSKQILQKEIYKRFQEDIFSALLFLGLSDKKIPMSVSLEFWRNFTGVFAEKLRQTPDLEEIREKIRIPPEDKEIVEILEKAPFMTGAEYLDDALLKFIWSRINTKFQQEIKGYDGTVEDFLKTYSPEIHLIGRVYFHLVENKKSEEYPFAFLATYSTGLSKHGTSRHIPLKFALKEYGNDSQKLLDLLTTVHLAAKESGLIADLLDSGEIFHPLAWTSKDAFMFLKEVVIYEKAGILCRIPDWWKSGASSFKLNVTIGNSSPKYLGMESILNFDTQLILGDSVITEKQVRKILEESEGLAYIKGKWVEVNSEKLNQVLEVFEKAKDVMEDGGLSLKEAMRMQLGAKSIFGDAQEDNILEVSNGEWLESVIDKLRYPNTIRAILPGKLFKAKLRPYQQSGLNWLHFLHSLQFGACLADDMGLGKTIQILAFLNNLKTKKVKGTNLLIIPASLLSNWQNETTRFAPSLKFFIAHPGANPGSKIIMKDDKFIDNYDLIITTYALIQRYESIKSYSWNYVILDEAQAIKNPGAKQTKAVKKLKSYNRIILTGTPIENRLSDLWSLYDFINPGLLGNSKEFTEYAKKIKDDSKGYGKLKKVISPYFLRRLKTDKSVISDLPDKIEMKTYAALSKKQIVLYKKLVNDIRRGLEELAGIQRKGIILASLIKFKQICNHPGQYLDSGDYPENDSGKFQRLREICETIFEKREKVLIFTQFKEITEPLCNFLTTVFGREGLILHGSIPAAKRKKIIERFQGKEYVPFFILSVKAGGVGLNLTEANHVIHFDRWWNPAVENQATDRAFRIGQKKNVVVHKFITKGTVEEKIDSMLEEKSTLSRSIIQSSKENWITEMDNKDIVDMFKLSL